jgi:uncharacterized protein YjlB
MNATPSVPSGPATPPSDVIHEILQDDGMYPNNSHLPVLIYRRAMEPPERDPAAAFEQLFQAHGWTGSWRDGIYAFHHYHSTTHEVLGVYRGSASVQLGGDEGITVQVAPGDVIVIPAGVAHRNLGAGAGFAVVGAYPDGRRPDMNYGRPGERPQADHNIRRVDLPASDPVYGNAGPLLEYWRIRR